ncbi:2-oxoacid:ferredoxin oxidoreductase subunit beta [Candidatus Pacearchaeota archaeon]|nr:2-oxoacid:ferredoxin oxidoreductase subunit beta [Candidatus Pacearchaeota archaeon]
MILESVKKALSKSEQKKLCMVTDIGCHGKIFDYLNISGIYGLHGRALPTAMGITLGNPNLNVLAFMGDGAIYSEGIAHFIHAGRFNPNLTLIVHDNQSFSLTTGQPTPTSQQGYKSKAIPMGEPDKPMNPIKLALASGTGFIARCNAKDPKHTAEVLRKAVKHKGFSFVEIIQDCLIFNKEINDKDKLMYNVKDNKNKKMAERMADKWDYTKKGKIPIGVLYQEKKPTLTDKWPQLKNLEKKGVGWKGK